MTTGVEYDSKEKAIKDAQELVYYGYAKDDDLEIYAKNEINPFLLKAKDKGEGEVWVVMNERESFIRTFPYDMKPDNDHYTTEWKYVDKEGDMAFCGDELHNIVADVKMMHELRQRPHLATIEIKLRD